MMCHLFFFTARAPKISTEYTVEQHTTACPYYTFLSWPARRTASAQGDAINTW